MRRRRRTRRERKESGWRWMQWAFVAAFFALLGIVAVEVTPVQSPEAVRDSLRAEARRLERELIAERAVRYALEEITAFSETHACYYRGDRNLRGADR